MIYLKCGDCFELMKEISAGSIDLILCDLPYGTMKGASLDGWKNQTTYWDNKLDINRMFNEYERILRENGTIILFSQEPYTSELRTYKRMNIEFAYPLIWKKDHFANCLFSKKAPVSYFEDLSVFYKKYDSQGLNPLRKYAKRIFEYIGKPKKQIITEIGQSADHFFRLNSMQFALCTEETYNKLIEKYEIDKMNGFITYKKMKELNQKRTFNLPKSSKIKSNILEYKKDYQGLHPTQKPVALLEDLIKTYTNEGDIVLDNCMGSGTTGVACKKLNRNFIGYEIDEKYFNIAKERIENTEV